jgi:hypothetical protein
MSSAYEVKAAKAAFPESAADPSGLRGVMAVPFTTASSSTQIPAALAGKRLYMRTTADVQVSLSTGAAGQALTLNAAAVPGTGNAARGWTLQAGAGAAMEGIAPAAPAGQSLWLNLIGVAGAGVVEFFCRELVAP